LEFKHQKYFTNSLIIRITIAIKYSIGDDMRRGFFGLICSIGLLVTISILPLINSYISANSQIQTFSDDSNEKVIVVNQFQPSFELELPVNAQVMQASLKITFNDMNGLYPLNPQLTLDHPSASGGAETLWAFQNVGYGSLGLQQYFSAGTTSDEIVYKEGENNDDLKIYLPSTADVSSATINFTGMEFDHWSDDVVELNREPDGAGDYEPDLIIFKDSMYAVYRSYDDMVTNASDSDILINSTADGINWNGATEITSTPDSTPPFSNSYISADWWPTLEEFKNRLYCAWESNSTVTTNNLDHDIILRSSANGFDWSSNLVKLTDTWEGNYSNNPGEKNDWGADMAVFQDRLWMVWTTNNTDPLSGYSTPIGDIMISNSSDGTSWSNATDLTDGDYWYTKDYGPQLVVFNNSLYAVWITNNTILNSGDDDDFDIIYRNTTDGIFWNPPKVLNPNDNDPLTKKGSFDIQPTLLVHDNKLYCAWVSTSTKYTQGFDRDIVVSYSSDGNLTELQEVYEVTANDNEYPDHSPDLAVFNDKLYITWVVDVNDDSEILIRPFDIDSVNDEFGTTQRVNPPDLGGDDYRPQILEFKNQLYAAWVSNDPRTGTGNDRDIISRYMTPSNLPFEIGINVGGDGSWDIPKGDPLSSTIKELDLTNGFKNVLLNSTWVSQNSTVTQFGYRMCEIPLMTHFSGPGKILAENLNIKYDCTFTSNDFSDGLNKYLLENQDKETAEGTLLVPFSLTADTDGELKVTDISIIINYKPSIEFTNIPETGISVKEPVFRIKWTDFDPDDDANISLYYDFDNIGFNGKLIVENLSEDSDDNYFDWVWWNTIPNGGSVYIYSNISDGKNYYYNYSSGPLYLERINIDEFIHISILEPDGADDEAWDEFEIQLASFCPGEDAKISLFYDNDTSGFDGFAVDINKNGFFDAGDYITEGANDGIVSHVWDITQLQPGNSYYIYGKITNQWNITIYNYSTGPLKRAHMPAPRDFTLLDDLEPNDDNLTTHKTKPRLSWSKPETELEDNLEYVVKVWEGEDKTGDKKFDVETVATTITILKNLEYGKSYFSEIYAQTPDSRESMRSSINFRVINSAPEPPRISLTPEQPKTNDTLVCRIINESYDADYDTVHYSYRWFKNGNQQLEFNDVINIPSTATAKGEIWRCVVTPLDGIEAGANISSEVRIRNSVPTIKIISPNADGKYNENKVIFFEFEVIDADPGDSDNLKYIVYSDLEKKTIKVGYVPSGKGVVKFSSDLSKGKHNLRINVADGDASAEANVGINVKGQDTSDEISIVLLGLFSIIIIILIMLLIFFVLLMQIRRMRTRDEKEEFETPEQDLDEDRGDISAEEEIEDEEFEDEELDDEEMDEIEPEEDDLTDEELEDEDSDFEE
jgi:hypothetical protein